MKIVEMLKNNNLESGFDKFATNFLQSTEIGFNEEQANVLVKIINDFIDEADKWQRECMNQPSSLNRARNKLDAMLLAIPKDNLLDVISKKLFGNVQSLSQKICKFLPEEDWKELDTTFPITKESEILEDNVAKATEILDMAAVDELIDVGLFADDLEKSINELGAERPVDGNLNTSSLATDAPDYVMQGLATDLLSPEENQLKKLVALDLLASACISKDDDNTKANAPLIAIGAARASFKLVVEEKTRFRMTQLVSFQNVVNESLTK